MQGNLISFIQVLRSHDVRISPAETLDALAAAATLGYDDREQLRHGLGMALAKTPEEEAVYQQCFDQFFQRHLADLGELDQQTIGAAEPPEQPLTDQEQALLQMVTAQGSWLWNRRRLTTRSWQRCSRHR